MVKYSKQIMNDYINGEDVIGYDIEELENNIDFMIGVIDMCNDKNMYNMCGLELKKNFFFIKYLIDKFHGDADFILKVANEYMKYANKKEQLEIQIVLNNYLNYDFDDEILKLKIKIHIFYLRKKLEYKVCLDDCDNFFDEKSIFLGFDMVLDDYNDSEIIKEYFAKNMLNEIFNYNNLELEKLLHKMFKNKRNLIDMGINNFLIQYISKYDEFLAGYVSVHVPLLAELNKKIVRIIDRWDIYEIKKEREILEIIIDEIDKFTSENMFFVGMELSLLRYILVKFNLEEAFDRHNIDLSSFYGMFDEIYIDVRTLEFGKLNIEMYGVLKKFIDRIDYVCQNGEVPDDYIEEEKKNNKGKCKIYKLYSK